MNRILSLFILLLPIDVKCQDKEIIYLWPGKVPGELKDKHKPVVDTTSKDEVLRYSEITNPAIEIWDADPKKVMVQQ